MGVLKIADKSEFFKIDRWWVQYPVIYDIFRDWIIVIALAVTVLAWLTVTLTEERKKERGQKIDNLPVLVTCRSGTSAMLSSKFNGPIAHERTQ